MGKFRIWLAEQSKATIFNSKDCERAAALYAAGRGAEAEQAIAHLPPQIKHAMMSQCHHDVKVQGEPGSNPSSPAYKSLQASNFH